MQYQTDKKDDELIKGLEEADTDVRVKVAANLAKIGRWDIVGQVSRIPGLLEDVKA